jgi:hypothetical protein
MAFETIVLERPEPRIAKETLEQNDLEALVREMPKAALRAV